VTEEPGVRAWATFRSVLGRTEPGATDCGEAEFPALSGGVEMFKVLPSLSSVSRRGVVGRTSVLPFKATCRTFPRVACDTRSKPTPLLTTMVLFTVV